MKSKIQKFFKVINLGYRMSDKCLVASIYILLVLRNRMEIKSSLKYQPNIMLNFKNLHFPFTFDSLIDIDLVWEIFIIQIYATDTPLSATTIFDLGSNKGASIMYFAALFSDATIYAFEPDPRNVVSLKKTIEPIKDRVVLYEKAVTERKGKLTTLYYSDELHWSSGIYLREKTRKEVQVSTISLDHVVEGCRIDCIDLLKFDIEGAEYEVFTNFHLLDIVKHIVGEVHSEMSKSVQGAINGVPSKLWEHFHIHRSENIIKGTQKEKSAELAHK